jgi:hypothetical protein
MCLAESDTAVITPVAHRHLQHPACWSPLVDGGKAIRFSKAALDDRKHKL